MKAHFSEVRGEADGMRVARRQCEADKKDLMGENSTLKIKVFELEQRHTFWTGYAWGVASMILIGGAAVYMLR
jgi:hypothetical protein